EIGLSTLVRGRQQRELALVKSFAEPIAKRSATATERLTTTAQQLDRDLAELGGQLGRLGCAGPAPSAACDGAARAFLARPEGNLDGVQLRLGDTARDVVRPDVSRERAAASAAAFAPLAREPGDLTLRPVALDTSWLLVTRRTTDRGQITAWGLLDRLR